MSRRRKVTLIGLTLVLLMITACGVTSNKFVPAPPPVDAGNVMNIQQLKVGDGQLMSITSPTIDVQYRENGSGAGKTSTEIINLPDGTKATMLSIVWGDWEKSSITIVNYYDPQGNLSSGLIEARFEEASIFQLIGGHSRATIDRSSVTLIYINDDDGMILRQIQYAEKWGPGKQELAFGGMAVWTDHFPEILPEYFTRWGFWETVGCPADLAMDAIVNAMKALQDRGLHPDYYATDLDSGREVIGRQTGLVLRMSGQAWGEVQFEYGSIVGRQPNTPFIGSGALRLIEWNLGDQQYWLLVLSPRLTPVGSALYLFIDDADTAKELNNEIFVDRPQLLYQRLRDGIPGVFLAVHGIGDIGMVTASTGDSTVHVGDSGGVQFRTIGKVEYASVQLATNLLAMLGPAQYQNGLYYAYKPMSGSGLSYYIAALKLMHAPSQTVFQTFSQDIGVLDRVLVPDLSIPPFVK